MMISTYMVQEKWFTYSMLIDGARNYVVIRSDHVTTYPPQKAAREIVCAAPDKCI
jgi:hypothetical protein